MVTTSCRTGRACYFEEKNDPDRIIDIVKASSSLPFVSPISYVDGEPMLDGGIADSIPLLRARELGFDNNLVVLTRNKGYRKSEGAIHLPPFVYGRYPQLREAIRRRYEERYERYLSTADVRIPNEGSAEEAALLIRKDFFHEDTRH